MRTVRACIECMYVTIQMPLFSLKTFVLFDKVD